MTTCQEIEGVELLVEWRLRNVGDVFFEHFESSLPGKAVKSLKRRASSWELTLTPLGGYGSVRPF
ncbi:MAG: hypothetical protein LZF60_380171 [Nitrospira sp.]|nr:MAG: hypothetical protein LZF60_380171 [Nitrospira sp.]